MRLPQIGLSLLLLLIAPNAIAGFTFTPPLPTSETLVTLQVRVAWFSYCLPESPTVTRTGNRIDIVWPGEELGCITLPTRPLNVDVPIGYLPAGRYAVFLNIFETGYRQTRLILAVENAEDPLAFSPRFVSSRETTEVSISSKDGFCAGNAPSAVEIAEQKVPFRMDGCRILATLPPHAAGAVDVTVRGLTVRYSTIRYVDPGAAPDEVLFERVLVPVLYNGGGAFGSRWVTDAEVRNDSTEPLTWFYDVASAAPNVAAGGRLPLSAFGNRSSGLLFFVPRSISGSIHFGGIVRDVSREQTSWGAELPFAREKDFRTGRMILPNVPIDPRYRTTLRLYGIDAAPADIRVTAEGHASTVVSLNAPCAASPCATNEPAHAAIDVGSAFPGLSGHAVTLIIEPPADGRRYWSLVSITNNDSQHVTNITPQ